jgi:hypothetical protein
MMATTEPPLAVTTARSLLANLTAGLLLVLLLAGGGYLGYTHLSGGSASKSSADANTLQLVVGGIPSDLPAVVPIRGMLSARFALDPDGEHYHHTLTLVFVDGLTGEPVAAPVTVHAVATMRFMDLDAFTVDSVASDGGAARIPLTFPMPGEWQIDLTLETPDGQATVALFATILV